MNRHNLNFILGAKPGDHKFLFSYVASAHENGKVTEIRCVDPKDPKTTHFFRFINNVPLNASNQDTLINFLEYQEVTPKKTSTFTWVTNFTITSENVFKIMRGGRARWKIENETFNTLKNQGYHLEHNYGLGEKHLSENFGRLTMLDSWSTKCNNYVVLYFLLFGKNTNPSDLFGKKYDLFSMHFSLIQWKICIELCLLV
ncbi:hypothetical protein SAMN02746065_1147 [Desulfocicer vacuolatum DSM 3385]|uniref:Transposase DDE domain-containing protein n=1 Tax=Desulfocicer vacuolatum DSM 3385 TaxID=1121400 RepID=A0A1W2CX70_9BACT|nr:hypothetical protein [Desulfocicer vacuolatum]SMC89494.1 hypothetical protein SAMN02746065_1147 [Desulfocicer vacuolatum DSM 3385]